MDRRVIRREESEDCEMASVSEEKKERGVKERERTIPVLRGRKIVSAKGSCK